VTLKGQGRDTRHLRLKVAGQRLELAEVVASSSRTAAGLGEVEGKDDAAKLVEGDHSEFEALVTQPCSGPTSAVVVIANHAVNTADQPLQETPM